MNSENIFRDVIRKINRSTEVSYHFILSIYINLMNIKHHISYDYLEEFKRWVLLNIESLIRDYDIERIRLDILVDVIDYMQEVIRSTRIVDRFLTREERSFLSNGYKILNINNEIISSLYPDIFELTSIGIYKDFKNLYELILENPELMVKSRNLLIKYIYPDEYDKNIYIEFLIYLCSKTKKKNCLDDFINSEDYWV